MQDRTASADSGSDEPRVPSRAARDEAPGVGAAAQPRFRLEDLAELIAARAQSTAERSYTKSLLLAGPSRAAKKFGEEAIEAAIAIVEGDRNAIVSEAADALYHLLVALQTRDICVQDVLGELQRRTALSGHEEKAGRQSS